MKRFSFVLWMLCWPIISELIFILYHFMTSADLDHYFAVTFIMLYFLVGAKLLLDDEA
jgi:hypothetical protein